MIKVNFYEMKSFIKNILETEANHGMKLVSTYESQ